ncbi:microsomal dipeptidase-like Zn-dependent dipeptidase [Novosphingobium kunmingense]|uniref:Microsomal dipeptidase-like Zn-dependent dipeptidase n=1 Tax=Novosphingobium kunmingense TaxID=1211806 RepID=A0A2N0H591_9SPHN|nr:dipeptidase [Novosphingobium kunmingense]PKB14094.1 microsomal dipeptidase-like Zn-dependent dipeptidase [Novosphingobium kunmingense]
MTLRKRVWIPLVLAAVAAIGFFGVAPGKIEGDMNQIDGKPLIPVSAEARALHAGLQIVDLHSDTLMWKRDLLGTTPRGHEDLVRMQQGNVALQVFSSVTKTPRGQNYDANGADTDNITALVIAQMQPVRTWTSLLERSLWHATKLDRAVAGSEGRLAKVTDEASLDALLAARAGKAVPVGALLSIEGLQDLEGKAGNLDRLYAAGFRMAGLTHFFDNELAGSMHGIAKGGMTPLGRQVMAAMEDRGMIVDIAHCSHQCVSEILAAARRPVVSSHGGVQATCKVNRNLTDEEVRGVARTGGVIGIGYWDGAVCDTDPRAVARAMKHVRDLVGVQHVALGSDYDGATTVRFHAGQLEQVTQALLDAGFTPDEIRAVMGGNALRVIRAGLVPLAQVKAEPPAA